MVTFKDLASAFLLLVSSDLDEFTTQGGIVKVEGPTRVVLFTPAHIQFAKYGRGPGKNPPLDPILDWVSGKGIIFDGTDERGTAFAIQKSIAKNGTLNWVPNAPNAIEEALQSNIKKYNDNLAKLMSTNISEQVNEIWERTFPDEIDLKL